MTFKSGDFIEVGGRTVRLTKDTAEIANAVLAWFDEQVETSLLRHEHFPEGTYGLPSGAVARNASSFTEAFLTAKAVKI